MPELKRNATAAFIHEMRTLEHRADDCYKQLQLLRVPRNQATWALLTTSALKLEHEVSRWGADSAHFQAALLNVGRACPTVAHWIDKHGRKESRAESIVLEPGAFHPPRS